MQEMNAMEIESVSGAGFWKDVGYLAGQAYAYVEEKVGELIN